HQQKTPPSLGELRADVPAELVRIVARMMAKEPDQRYQTPGEVADALTPFVPAQRQIRAAKTRRRWITVAAGIVLLAAIGVAAWSLLGKRPPTGESAVRRVGGTTGPF